jgi:hypothetical protein
LQPFFLAPELPYSFLPEGFLQRFGPILQPALGPGIVRHDPAWIQGGQRLESLAFQLVSMRRLGVFSGWFAVPVVVGAHPFGYTAEAVLLGGPFLIAQRWRLVVDYALTVPGGPNPPNIHPAHPIGELTCP